MTTFVALLRAVNVGGRKVAMADLRKLVEGLGFTEVKTYIQSGNLVLAGKGTAAAVEAKLEKAIAAKFGIEVPVIARTAEQWRAYLAVPKPFAAEEPNRVVLGLSKQPPKAGAAAAIAARAQAGERVEVAGDAVWFHYPEGMGKSKLTPVSIDKAVGSPLTARNLNTVRKLAGMAGITAP
jgi:uncharacterized protein (DUF1697 family)